MKKLKVSADGYIIGTVVFWLVFIAMVVFSSILYKVLGLETKSIAGLTAQNFIGIMLILGLFIGLVVMMDFASLLLVSSKYASSANYKAEARWAVSVFALNLIFTAIFITYFVIKVLMSDEVAYINGGQAILDDKVLVSIQTGTEQAIDSSTNAPQVDSEGKPVMVPVYGFTLRISNIINYLAIVGLVFVIIAFSLSIAISNRTDNVVKKIKEYEKVNIY